MNRTILFSPVGGTDPISQDNLKDGSLLHICRVYDPDKVYMYMSKEILDKHHEDNRYVYCLKELAKIRNKETEYEIIERPDLVSVHEFDFYYDDFYKIVAGIMAKMDDSDRLLLNISSGTPAMKSALIVLKTLGEFDCTAIQVATPEKKMQKHTYDGYDVKLLWELFAESMDENENRCKEVVCPSLSNIKNEEIIKKLIRSYDYSGALEVIRTMPAEVTVRYASAVEMAAARLLFDFRNVDKLSATCGVDFTPIKDSGKRKYYEYALNLEIKLRKNEYADFVRAITPLIVDLFVMVIKKTIGTDIYGFCYVRDGIYNWDMNKLSESGIGQKIKGLLDQEYRNGFAGGIVRSDHLAKIIEYDCNDMNVRDLVTELRGVETKVRNIAAHDIVSITEDEIKRRTGFTPTAIMNKLKKMFSYSDINVKEGYWSSYDDMNYDIIRLIET